MFKARLRIEAVAFNDLLTLSYHTLPSREDILLPSAEPSVTYMLRKSIELHCIHF